MFSYTKFNLALATGAVPGAPTNISATGGANRASTITFTAPTDKGLPATILDYLVTSSPGGITATGSASPITITGLTNQTAYTFTVKARNATGYGPASNASNSITPLGAIPASVDVLIVAGGGAGGQFYGCGGGGGGLLISNGSETITVTANTAYTVTVGAGGAYTGSNGVGPRGSNSVFNTANANGGGGGGWNSANGTNGGSGGGKNGTTVQASYTNYSKYGNNGSTSGSGGGGGAGDAGSGRNGGNGVSTTVGLASPSTFSGGAAGEGGTANGSGGGNYPNKGGGGRGDALTNLPYDSAYSAGSGGSGFVAISYFNEADRRNISNISAGLTYTTVFSGGFKRYQFTAGTGTIKWE